MGVAVDSAGNVYTVPYAFGSTVTKVSATGTVTNNFITTGGDYADGLAFDASGNLYISHQNGPITQVTFSAPGVVSAVNTNFIPFGSYGQSLADGMAFDSSGNLYIANYGSNTISKVTFLSPGVVGSVNGTFIDNTFGLNQPHGLAFDASGNMYISNSNSNTISKVTFSSPGVLGSVSAVVTSGLSRPLGLTFDAGGSLYVANNTNNTISKVTFSAPGVVSGVSTYASSGLNLPFGLAFNSSGVLFAANQTGSITQIAAGAAATTQVMIRSSLSSRALSLGSTNNFVTGINLTDAELARILTTSSGTVTIGDSSQTGNITFTTATPATTAGAATVVVQSTSGGGRIVLDDASGAGTALNGNGGSVSLTAGTGGIVEAATNTAWTADLGGATAVSLTSAGAIGTGSLPLQLGTTNLTSSTAANSSNQFLKATGAVTIDAGGLNAGSGTVELDGGTFTLGGSQRINDNTQVTVNGATFALAANSETVNTLTLISGSLTGSSGVLTSTNTIQTRAGSIGAILAGTNGLTKSTAGTVTLSGANTYTGVTAVNAGRLNVNGSLSDGPDAIDLTVAAGATLGGTGTIHGVVSNSGTTAPGNSPGILNTGSYTFANDSIFEVELGGTTPGDGTNHHDQLNVSGTVTIDVNVTLSLAVVNGFIPAAADSFVIVNNDDNDAVSGTFGGLAEGTLVTVGGVQKKITYVGGDGNDIAIVALDAPTVTVAAANVVYDGQPYAATGTVTGVSGVPGSTLDGVGLAFTYYLGATATGTPVTAPTNVGTYTVVASFAGSASYVAASSAPATFEITARTLTVSATGINKTYDATTDASVTLSDDRVAGDVFTTETYATATFDTKNVGTGKTVSVCGIAISGGAAGNYTFNTTAQTTADVTRATLVGSITADDKVYDTTSTATITGRSLSGVLLSDDVSYVGGTATFNNKNVGVGKTVTGTGLSLSGTDADNYTVNDTATDLADITAATLVGSITADNKTYDGLDTATIATRTLSGVLLSDDVTYTGGVATFDNKNVGVGKTVTGTGLGLSGADAGNYTVNSTATTTADVTVRTLTVSATGVNKVYDTTTSATVTLSDDRVAGDVFSDSYTTATFDAGKNAGAGKGISVSGIAISGVDAANYVLASTTASATADITPRPITGLILAASKVYDGTTAATITAYGLIGGLGMDQLLFGFGTATFADKHAGTGKTVTATGLVLSGADAGNYSVNSVATTTADITQKALTITAVTNTKVYDSTNNAAAVPTVVGLAADDTVTDLSEVYDTPTVGSGKTLSVNTYTVNDGNGGGNYAVSLITNTTGVITPATDIQVVSATTNGATTLTVSYNIANLAAPQFNIGLYRSDDDLFAGDLQLAMVTISLPADLTVGSHVKTFTIGTGVGQVPLPGAGATEVDTDYFLLASADPTNVILEGGGTADEYNVAAITGAYHATTGAVMVQGGSAADTVSVSGATVVTVNGASTTYTSASVTGIRVRTHGGNDVVNLTAATKATLVHGGAGNDTLSGGTVSDLLFGGIDNDSLFGNAGDDVLAGEAGDDELTGGLGNDSYTFAADAALGADTLDESAGGTDTLDFSATSTLGVNVNLGLTAAQTVNANLTLTLSLATAFENVVGGAQSDSLTGNANNNVLIGAGGDDSLSGGAGNDTYRFTANAPLGSDTLDESGGGIDTLDFSTTTAAVTLNLGLATSQVVNANLSLTLGSATTIENVIGGAGADTLSGNSLDNALTGGAGNDTYQFAADSPLGFDTLNEAGGGIDTLDFSATISTVVTVNLATAGVAGQVVNANLKLNLSSATTFENVIGGAQGDTLTGNTNANTLSGGAGNDTLVGGAGNDLLIGGSGNDVYSFTATAALGSDVLDESGGGIDTLNFSLTTSQTVTVDLSIAASQSVNSFLSLTLSASDTLENVTGGSLNDTLTGNSLANILTGGAGNDALNGGEGNDRLVGGAGNDSLSGGTGDDIYAFAVTSSLGTDTLDETAGGVDTLDFTGTTAALTVNLGVATTQVVSGTNLSLVLGSASVFENVVGGTGADVFIGNQLDNVLNGGAGNDTLTGGVGNDLLVGGAGNDLFKYAADASLGSDTLDESGGGVDTLDFSTTVGSAVSVDLGATSPQVVNTNVTLTLLSASAFENVLGGAQGDALTGNANANTLTGNGGNDLLVGGAGNDLLTGGAGDDVYAFTADSALGSDTLNETGGGIDTLDFSATTGSGVTINLGLATAQVVNANLTLILGSISTFENVVGGAQGDTLIGNANANILSGGAGNDTLTGGAGNDSLIGGTGNDVYSFVATSALGTDTLDETLGGTDTLNFTGTTAALTVNLGVATTQVVAGTNLSLVLGSATVFENITGGSGIDTLIGNSLDNVLSGAAGNDILTGGAGNDLLVGGTGNDTYKFAADAALDSDTLDESGGGVDTLDFSATTGLAVAVNLNVATPQVVNTNLTLTLSSASAFENILGGSQGDTLTGNANANSLTGNGGNDVLDGGAGNDALTGGAGDDVYAFIADSALGSDTLNETGGGNDTLDFSTTAGSAVAVNLGLATAQVVNANLTLTLGSATTFENVVGGSQADTLIGSANANTLSGGAGNDTLTGGAGNDALVGGAGDDAYFFVANAALGTDTLDDVDGVDLLDFSQTTVAITLDLATAGLQTVNANLKLVLSSDAAFEMVVGSTGNDTIDGNALNNVLIGGAGTDVLHGRDGRDLLFGGSGADTLSGDNDDDLLIGGLVTFYDESTKTLNRQAIAAMMAEWAQTYVPLDHDLDYATRVGHLRAASGGLNGGYFLDGTTVFDDLSLDSLFGQGGLDWFWKFGGDVADLNNGGSELVN